MGQRTPLDERDADIDGTPFQWRSFAMALQQLMQRAKLKNADLAPQIGMSPERIHDYKRGRGRPQPAVAEQMAAALGCTPEERETLVYLAVWPPPVDTRSGDRLKDTRYQLGELLERGPSGAVYRGIDHGDHLAHRPIIIKVIAAELADRPAFLEVFDDNAKLVRALARPTILTLHDAWRVPGAAYVVCEEARTTFLPLLKNGGLGWDDLADALNALEDALVYAHGQEVVHGSLHAGNLFQQAGATYALGDFRLVHELAANPPVGRRRPGPAEWPPIYLAPEQRVIVSGKRRPRPTRAADVYGLGILIHQLVTSALPGKMTVTNGDGVEANGWADVALPALDQDLPPQLAAALARATAANPLERYTNIAELAAAVRAALGLRAPRAVPGAELTTRNPYKGLAAFQEQDAPDFYGREAKVAELLARLTESGRYARFLAVVGPSGGGKSSLVRAGLLPALKAGKLPASEGWLYPDPIVPSDQPLERIEAALLRKAVNPPPTLLPQLREAPRGLLRAVDRCLPDDPTVELLLVIDQFEELFTLVSDEANRNDLLDSLVEAVTDPASRLRLVVTLRADFFDRPLRYDAFGKMLTERVEYVLPLNVDELRAAIVAPASNAGLVVEDGLVEAMVADVNEQPGALPLFQYALWELANQMEGKQLTLSAYRASGGVTGAVAQKAEAIYTTLDSMQREAVRQIFLRLVTIGEGVEDTRRRVRRVELVGDAEVIDEVLRQYGEARLLTFDHDAETREPTVEIAHEALLQSWERLREWLVEAREDLRNQQRLAGLAVEWVQGGREASFLVSGARLAQLESWAAQTTLALNAIERTYLGASIDQRDAELEAEQERQARELAQARALVEEQQRRAEEQAQSSRRLRRRAMLLLGALVLALLAALVAGGLGIQAVRREQQARVETLAAQSQAAKDRYPQRSLLLAVEAINTSRALGGLSVSAAEQSLRDALAHAGGLGLPGNVNASSTLAFSPDGHWLATGEEDEFDINGISLEEVPRDPIVRLWDLQAADPFATPRILRGHKAGIVSLAFSPDSRRLVSSSWDKTVRLWDMQALDPAAEPIVLIGDAVVSVLAFSPDKHWLAAGVGDASIVWDMQAADPAASPIFLYHHYQAFKTVNTLAFSADGRWLASGSSSVSLGDSDAAVRLWDMHAADPSVNRRVLAGPRDGVGTLIFSPDGRWLASGAEPSVLNTDNTDTTVWLWDMQAADLAAPSLILPRDKDRGADAEAPGSGWHWPTFSPDGRWLASGKRDGSVWLWDMQAADPAATPLVLRGPEYPINALAFSPDGRWLASSGDTTVRLWDMRAADPAATPLILYGHEYLIDTLTFSPDGRWLGSASNGVVRLWDMQASSPSAAPRILRGRVSILAFSPDGRWLTSGGYTRVPRDTTVQRWDMQAAGCRQELSGRVNLRWLCYDGVCKNSVPSPPIGGSLESYHRCRPNRTLGYDHD